MNIFDEAKKAVTKAVTKISDEVNRGKYDASQLNTALLQDTDEATHNESVKVALPFYICVSSEKSCAICTKGNCSTIS